LLSLPPDRRGLIPEATQRLTQTLGERLRERRRLPRYDRLHILREAWQYSDGWMFHHDAHGSVQLTAAEGAWAEVPWSGDACRVIGRRIANGGSIDLFLDGEPLMREVDATADLDLVLPRQILFAHHRLPPGDHRLRLVARPGRSSERLVIALEAVEAGWAET
jgi:hypothetical protein